MSEKTDLSDKSVVDFAINNKVSSVYKGKNPEYGSPAYYLFRDDFMDFKFQNNVTELELKIFREYKTDFEILTCRCQDLYETFFGQKIWPKESHLL